MRKPLASGKVSSGVPAALVGGDVIFVVAFWMLGARMLKGR
jgi:hypothetical protein